MQIEFIKRSEYNFETSDLAEMIKYVKMKRFDPLVKIFSEGDESNDLFFIIQGTVVATYRKTEADKQAIFTGRKDAKKNPDDIMAALTTVQALKELAGQAKIEQEEEEAADEELSEGSRATRMSKVSRASKRI